MTHVAAISCDGGDDHDGNNYSKGQLPTAASTARSPTSVAVAPLEQSSTAGTARLGAARLGAVAWATRGHGAVPGFARCSEAMAAHAHTLAARAGAIGQVSPRARF